MHYVDNHRVVNSRVLNLFWATLYIPSYFCSISRRRNVKIVLSCACMRGECLWCIVVRYCSDCSSAKIACSISRLRSLSTPAAIISDSVAPRRLSPIVRFSRTCCRTMQPAGQPTVPHIYPQPTTARGTRWYLRVISEV